MTNNAENLPERQSANNLMVADFYDRRGGVAAQPHNHHMWRALGIASLVELSGREVRKLIHLHQNRYGTHTVGAIQPWPAESWRARA